MKEGRKEGMNGKRRAKYNFGYPRKRDGATNSPKKWGSFKIIPATAAPGKGEHDNRNTVLHHTCFTKTDFLGTLQEHDNSNLAIQRYPGIFQGYNRSGYFIVGTRSWALARP